MKKGEVDFMAFVRYVDEFGFKWHDYAIAHRENRPSLRLQFMMPRRDLPRYRVMRDEQLDLETTWLNDAVKRYNKLLTG